MLVGRAFLRSQMRQMPVLFLAIGFALGVPTSPKTTAASAIRQLQPDGTESLQSVPPDASGTCPQGTCPIGTCPQGTCPHGPKPAGTKPAGTKPAGTRPYETREKATINSCVPDKSAPDCPMPPVCGDCGGEQECTDWYIVPNTPLAVSIDNPKFCPGCVPSTHKNTAGTCDFGDRRSEEEKKLNPIESMGFTSMTLETQNYCSCTCNVDRAAVMGCHQ